MRIVFENKPIEVVENKFIEVVENKFIEVVLVLSARRFGSKVIR